MPMPTVEQLRERVKGDVITPDDPRYDTARKVYNAMIDRRPALICQCIGASDVRRCVLFAPEEVPEEMPHESRDDRRSRRTGPPSQYSCGTSVRVGGACAAVRSPNLHLARPAP